jgi:CheY-like chemotaxis protein
LKQERQMESPKILVVDDEEAIRSFLVEALTHWGYRAAQAARGVEALEILKDQL